MKLIVAGHVTMITKNNHRYDFNSTMVVVCNVTFHRKNLKWIALAQIASSLMKITKSSAYGE
ncbi:MAG: hypothetical protein HN413_13980 [Chloroflexi bacterium]|jgi:hypothetical protein|nr:hypothetical protein [Chloroflexota bacterium]